MALPDSPTILLKFVPKITVANALVLLFACMILSVFYQIIFYRFFHPLAVFDGPFWGSVTRLWIAYHNIIEDERAVCAELHKKYGMIDPVCCLVKPRGWASISD